MDINNSASKENSDITSEITGARDQIARYLRARISEKENAIAGEQPDDKGNYSQDYYEQKDRRDQLNTFLEIVLSKSRDLNSFNTVEDFIQEVCQEIQNFPEKSFEQLFIFIEQNFPVQIKPITGPTTFYISWLNHWAERYGVAPDEIERIMPFEDFQKFEQQNDTAARIKIVIDNFGDLG